MIGGLKAMLVDGIIGGVGVFAARRTHLFKGMPADNSVQPGVGLNDLILNLGVGFEAY